MSIFNKIGTSLKNLAQPKQSGGLAASNTNMSMNPAMLPSKNILNEIKPANVMRNYVSNLRPAPTMSVAPKQNPSILSGLTSNTQSQNAGPTFNTNTQTLVPTQPKLSSVNTNATMGTNTGTTNNPYSNIQVQGTTPTYTAPEAPIATPTQPQVDPMAEIRKRILASYDQTPEERMRLEELTRLNESFRLGQQGIQDQTIPMTDITGQQASLERRYQGRAGTLKDEITLRQAQRQAMQERGLKELELSQTQEEKPISIDGKLVQRQPDGSYKEVYSSKGSTGGVLDTTGQAWAKYVQNGGKISDVPDEYRNAVVLGMNQGGVTTPAQQQSISQAQTALSTFDQIFNNPALNRGALNRGVGGIIPGSNANDLKSAITTIQSLIGFDALQKMREASPTGGALGSISDREITYLQSVAGSLALPQSDKQLIQNLERIKTSFEVLKLINSQDGSSGSIDGIPFTKQGDNLVTPDGFKRLPDGSLQSFNSAGNASASDLSQAIARQESGSNYGAMNRDSGALGKYQIMPATLKGLGYNVTPQQFLSNPRLQDEAHTKLIQELTTRYNGNVDKILADYYGGPKAAQLVGTSAGNTPQGKYPSINQYVAQVRNRLNQA